MAKFRYNATDGRGKWVSGESLGESREDVEARLKAEGLAVESLVEAEDLRPISLAESLDFVEQLASLAKSGLPLPSGLRAAGEEVDSPGLRSLYRRLADRVEAGEPLDQAIASGRERFPAHLQGLILAGARTGRLAEVLGEAVRNANLGAELRTRFWTVAAYPALLTIVVLTLVVCICKVSVDAADAVLVSLTDFGIQRTGIDTQSQVIGVMARIVADRWLGTLIVAGLLGLGAYATARLVLTPARRRQLANGVPVLGPLSRYTALTEFCRLMAMLLEAETPLPEALRLAGGGVRDADLAQACDRMAHAVDSGEPLSKSLHLWDSAPAGLGQLFRWSEGQRSLPEALRLAGDMFEARARSQSAFASNVLNTFLALLILWWVGFAMATLYLPLLSLINLISRLSG